MTKGEREICVTRLCYLVKIDSRHVDRRTSVIFSKTGEIYRWRDIPDRKTEALDVVAIHHTAISQKQRYIGRS